MNTRQRFLGTLKGEKVNRVPIILDGFNFSTREEIKTIEDPGRREIAYRIFPHTISFINHPSFINRYLVTPPQFIKEVSRKKENGNFIETLKIDTPKGKLTAILSSDPLSHTTWTIKYPVESLADIEKIRSVPWELPFNLTTPDFSKLPSTFEKRGILKTGISSPFVCVAGMMPYQYFLELCATEFNLIKELTVQCKEKILSVLDVILADKTIEYVWMGGCEWLTPPMASPKLYEELIQVFEAEIISKIHKAKALCHIHCHGNVRDALPRTIQRGGDNTEPVEPPPDGDITMAEAKKLAAGRITLGGNIECRILCIESEETVETAVRAAFANGKERFVLRPTEGPSPILSEQEFRNYMRMIDVWEELSPLN